MLGSESCYNMDGWVEKDGVDPRTRTVASKASMHVDLASGKGEAKTVPGGGRDARYGNGEICPGNVGGFVHVKVV